MLAEKAKKIRLVIFDVDGILSTGQLFYSNNGIELKDFNVHDGLGMQLLQKTGVIVAIITSRQSDLVTQRMQDLGITHVYQKQINKLPAYEALKQQLNLTDDQVAYMGDDFPDLILLRRAGLSVTVANAPKTIQQYVDWVTNAKGGEGAARELCEFIMQAQNTYTAIVESYL